MKVKDCRLIKPLAIRSDKHVIDAAKKLKESKQRRIIIFDAEDKPIGIISTTDINNKVVADNKDPKDTKCIDIMTSPIYLVCDIDDSLDYLYTSMMDHKTYFVPVTKNGKLHAILTYGELMAHINKRLKNG